MFGTSGVRGPFGAEIDASLALDIAHAVAVDADRVVVGRDARDTGRALTAAMESGFVECGVDVVTVGTAATPTIARGIETVDADAGVAITASHNPAPDNGIKLWTPSGQAFDSDAQATIERRIERGTVPHAAWDEQGTTERWDRASEAHLDDLVTAGAERTSDAGLSGLHVVVDVGNGMGGVTADALYELGATVETLNAQPDGRFPARPSEPTAQTCEGLIEHVAARDADLGIAHDGDADRMMAVDDEGRFVAGDALLAVFATEFAVDGGHIAVPVDTSLAVDDAVETVGASVVHTRVGDVYVAERARDADVTFGGEPSGAWIFPDETLCPDGPLAAVILAALAASRPLSERVDAVPTYPTRRDAVETERKAAVMDAVTAQVADAYDDVTGLDGVRVETADGWFLIRASGTQPLVRVTAEARDPDAADAIHEEARAIVAAARKTT
ncbi:phosphoglucosamine mutase [Halorubrum gandharaense]